MELNYEQITANIIESHHTFIDDLDVTGKTCDYYESYRPDETTCIGCPFYHNNTNKSITCVMSDMRYKESIINYIQQHNPELLI